MIRMNVEKDRYDEAKLYTLVKNVVGDGGIQFGRYVTKFRC